MKLKLIIISWIITCIFGNASILCAQEQPDPIGKIQSAFALVQQLEIKAAQAGVIVEIQKQLAGAAKDIQVITTPKPEEVKDDKKRLEK